MIKDMLVSRSSTGLTALNCLEFRCPEDFPLPDYVNSETILEGPS